LKNNLEAAVLPSFPPSVIVQVKALACELPHRLGLPLSRLSLADIRQQVIAQVIVAQVSGSTLWRWLSADAIRPWQHRSWIFPRDPDFARKAGRILDLYARIWQGKPLHSSEFVISADEKASIQARRRKQTSLPTAAGRPMRVEHEYFREGAWTYLAAWDVHRAKLFGHCEKKNGIAPTDRLIAEVMRREPYKSAKRVFGSWITARLIVVRKQCNAFDPDGATLFLCTLPFTPAGSTKLKSISLSFKEWYSLLTIFPRSPTLRNASWIFRSAMSKRLPHFSGLSPAMIFALC
jgi:hypothetical protein